MMRPLEALFLALAVAALIISLPLGKPRPRLFLALSAAGASLGVLEGLIEGVRWQLFPAYLVLGLFALPALVVWLRRPREDAPQKRRRWPRIAAFVLGLLGLGASAALAVLLPVFSFEPPTGPHAVGVTSYEWVDVDRTDEHPKAPSHHRRLVVKVWYPAAPSAARPERYLDPQRAEGGATALKLPSFVMSHLPLVSTNAARDIPLAEGGEPFPVLLYSHGYPGLAEQNTFEAEELASHGYVVFGINHTYDAALVVFGDGTVAPAELPGDVMRLDTLDKVLGPRLAVAVADARFVLNEITKLQETDPRWKGRLDLGRVGYFGHSFGGATAHAALAADSRFRAGINMDGAHFGISADARPSQPFLLMNGEKLTISDAQLAQLGMSRRDVDAFVEDVMARWDRSYKDAKGTRYRAIFPGLHHMGFSDTSLLTPLLSPRNLPARKAHRLINQYTLAFFDTHLKGKASPLLSGAPGDPAVQFTRLEPPRETGRP